MLIAGANLRILKCMSRKSLRVLLSIWGKLYQIEKEIKHFSVSERLERRLSESVPLLNQLFDKIREIRERNDFLPKSSICSSNSVMQAFSFFADKDSK